MNLNHTLTEEVTAFLAEDIGSGDVTAAIIPENVIAEAIVTSRDSILVCGAPWFNAIFAQLDDKIHIDWLVAEGEYTEANTQLCRLTGSARVLLTGERTALNIMQTLSATATVSRKYAQAVAGTGCKVLDTRKTIPGLRLAQKYAVKCGGCYNHRIGLFDAILIKENHIMSAGSINQAVSRARQISSVPVEVEVENLEEFQQALDAKPDRIMLDNFTLADIHNAVAKNTGKIELEASGNVELENVRLIAETGVNYISVGALTKNIQAIDLSMRINFK